LLSTDTKLLRAGVSEILIFGLWNLWINISRVQVCETPCSIQLCHGTVLAAFVASYSTKARWHWDTKKWKVILSEKKPINKQLGDSPPSVSQNEHITHSVLRIGWIYTIG
jgi:hypothetical protein